MCSLLLRTRSTKNFFFDFSILSNLIIPPTLSLSLLRCIIIHFWNTFSTTYLFFVYNQIKIYRLQFASNKFLFSYILLHIPLIIHEVRCVQKKQTSGSIFQINISSQFLLYFEADVLDGYLRMPDKKAKKKYDSDSPQKKCTHAPYQCGDVTSKKYVYTNKIQDSIRF